ncbi:MAG: cyclic-di-AMP receptor [Anaerolineales bacterium]
MAPAEIVNQLVLVTVAGEQVGELTQRLTQDGYQVTQVDRGGLLQDIPVSLLIGVNQAQLPRLLRHVRECCHTRRRYIPAQAEALWRESLGMMIEAQVGGAVIYVLEIERFEQL